MFKAISGAMSALFVLGAIVQVNDPDPVLWVAIYLASAGASAMAAVGRTPPTWAVLVIGAAALGWGVVLSFGVPNMSVYGRMFDAWEMASLVVEEAREASGLLLIAAWMAVLWWHR